MGEKPGDVPTPILNHAPRAALAHLDHLVVQDIFLTETAAYADVILPASALAGRKGRQPSPNTNRQVQMGRRALAAARRSQGRLVDHPGDRAAHGACDGPILTPARSSPRLASLMPSLANISWDRFGAGKDGRHLSDRRAGPGPAMMSCSTRASRGPAALAQLVGRRKPRGRPNEVARRRIPHDPHHRPATRALAHRAR